MHCSSCGAQIPDTAAFCGYCGAKNTSRVITAEVQVQQPSENTVFGEIPADIGYANIDDTNNVPTENSNNQKFGIGTLIFFLIFTFILALGLGIFAGLYFNLIKVL